MRTLTHCQEFNAEGRQLLSPFMFGVVPETVIGVDDRKISKFGRFASNTTAEMSTSSRERDEEKGSRYCTHCEKT